MTCKLVLIEGLPGSGKSTHAKWAAEILTELGVEARLCMEGDLDHPADYDGVACYRPEEYFSLLLEYGTYRELLEANAFRSGERYFIPYRKMKNARPDEVPDELVNLLFRNDIYELPLDQNADLIAEKWTDFGAEAGKRKGSWVFECCFIQNPLTVGMVKLNAPKETLIRYVERLEQAVSGLDPLLIYIDQEDVDRSFRKAVEERPKEWSEGFIHYYTEQDHSFAKSHGLTGVEGTVEVLRRKRELALEIMGGLRIHKRIINNTAYDPVKSKAELREILKTYVIPQAEIMRGFAE